MKQLLLPSLAAIVLAGCATTPATGPVGARTAAADNSAALGSMKEMKVAFDIVDGNPQALMTKLTVIELTRKQLVEAGVTPRMVLSFRGDASYYTQTNLSKVKEADRADALKIAAQLRELRKAPGIETLEQCNVPLASRKLLPAELMPEVKLVGNGWISLVAYQQKGYGYIAP